MKTKVASLPLLLLLGMLAAPAPARAWVHYDAALGTLPQAQGWTLNEDIQPPVGYIAALDADGLHLSTLAFGNNVPENNGGGVWWSRSDVSINFASDFAVEASIRIDSAPNHTINASSFWPRPGFALAVYDVTGRIFWIGLGSGEIFLSNTAFGLYGSSNTVTAAFNTTDAHHLYRLERAAGGVGATLRIDGVVKLTLPALGAAEGTGAEIYFGDPTYWANSESHTSSVRYSEAVLDVGASTRPGRLWAAALGTPASKLGVEFRSMEGGALSLEIFDAAGRRVESSERDVTAGQSGRLEAAGAHPDGLYFYRLRLSRAAGSPAEASGRIVLVR